MLLNSIFAFILTMSNLIADNQSNYKMTANISCTQKANEVVFFGASNTTAYSIEGYIAYDGKVNFNNANEFTVYSNSITYSLSMYLNYKNGNTTSKLQEFVLSDSVSLPIQFTNETYNNDFDNLSLRLWVNEEEFHTQLKYGETVLSYKTYEYDATFSTEVNYNYSFLSSSFYGSLTSYLNLYNNETTYNEGYNTGYNTGYATGYNDASDQNSTAVTIFSGILSVGLLPVNFFLAILNFEVFGINIGAFVSALLTVAIVVIVTRMVVNGGNGKD